MAFEQCLVNLAATLGRPVSLREMDEWAELIQSEQVRRRQDGAPDDFLSAARSVAADIRADKFVQQRNAILNQTAMRSLRQTLDEIGNDGLGLMAVRVGVNTPLPGGRLSVDAGQKAYRAELEGRLLGGLRLALRETGIDHERWAGARDNQLELAKALRGESQDAVAVRVAKIINDVRESARARENRAGSARGKLEGYVTRQSYNPIAVQKAGEEAFINDMLGAVDPERTFARDRERLTLLRRERDWVAQASAAAQTELQSIAQDLQVSKTATLARRARQAEGRAETAETRQEQMVAQLFEGERAYGAGLQRYLEVAHRTRMAFEEGNMPVIRQLSAQLGEARIALSREHKRVQDLHAQFQRAEGKQLYERGRASEIDERLQEAIARYDKVEGFLNKLDALHERLDTYTTRLREPVTDARKYLSDVYKKIVGNLWLKTEGANYDTGVVPFQGATNIGKQRSAHREIHFKDAHSEVMVANKYGYGGIFENVTQEMQHAANATILMETFGPNARANHELLMRERKQAAQDRGDFATVRELDKRYHENQFAELDGTTRTVNDPTLAMWSGAWRALQNMAKLGGAWLSSIGDINNVAAELRYQGVGIVDSYKANFDNLFKTVKGSERRGFADLIGVGNESVLGAVHSAWQATDAVPGRIAKLQQLFFRLNLLAPWTDRLKIGAALTTARHFANNAGKTLGELGASEQRLLKMYGIDARRWDLIRQYGVRTGEDGVSFLLPDGVDKIPLGAFYDLATDRFPDVVPGERWLRDARDRTATAWRALIVDRTDFAVITPSARERAIMNQGTPRGTPLGEALRAVMQFKGFPIAMITKAIGREVRGQPINTSTVLRMTWLIAEMTAMGYMIGAAKDVIKGKEPRPLDERKTYLAAVAQGGGFGLYGDFLFGEYSRFGRSALASLAGPTFGQIDDVMELLHNAKAADEDKNRDKMARAALRTIVGNMPGASLFWVRPALDMLMLYPIYESLSPGYTKRQQQRTKREEGRAHIWNPATLVWGP